MSQRAASQSAAASDNFNNFGLRLLAAAEKQLYYTTRGIMLQIGNLKRYIGFGRGCFSDFPQNCVARRVKKREKELARLGNCLHRKFDLSSAAVT